MTHLFQFNYCNPTRLLFGPEAVSALGTLVPTGARVLLMYGSGSIRRNGAYDEVMKALVGHVHGDAGYRPMLPPLEALDDATAGTLTAAFDAARVMA